MDIIRDVPEIFLAVFCFFFNPLTDYMRLFAV